MGKNNKKVKSERVNAIRKQYDAFLEEDRKRKDRNEYILERLDKMRSCTAVVPVRHTQTNNVFADLTAPIYEKTHPYPGRSVQFEKPIYTLNQVDNPSIITTLNEEAMVKELSKKYILIPKHQQTVDFEHEFPTKSSVDDVNDWRSKYNILEELKKNEKEEVKIVPKKERHPSTISFDNVNSNETTINNELDNPEFIINPNDNLQKFHDLQQPILNTTKDTNTKNTVIEKELFDTTNYPEHTTVLDKHSEFNALSECNSNIEGHYQSTDDLTEKEKLQTKYELECKPESEENYAIEMHNNQDLNPEFGWQEEHMETEHLLNSNLNEQEEINEPPIQSQINSENDINEINTHTRDVHEDVYRSKIKQNINSEVNVESKTIDIPAEKNSSNAKQAQSNEENIQAVTKEEINDEPTVVLDQEMQPELTENVDPQVDQIQQYLEYQTDSQQAYENTVDETQIQQFEAEQNNMFYSEQTGDYTYDQTSTVDNTTVEYANNEGYEPNENYAYYEETPHNQEYSNDYEETQQNQDNSNEIDKHEESTEQYDPNYQNQYENYNQEDLQPEAAHAYTAEEYEAQQNFDQAIYEESNYNAVEEVQQQLDTEEGYTKPLEEVEGNLDDTSTKEATSENPIVEQEVKVTS